MSKPTVIIAKLEDCPDWLDRTLVKNYWKAEYHLESLNSEDEGMLDFRFGKSSPVLEHQLEKFEIRTYAIITAFNPRSELLTLPENMERHERLRASLRPHCRLLRNSISQNTDGSWQEPGFWALDIDLEIAVDIGSAFGQMAIVCWRYNYPAALWWLQPMKE